MEWRWGAGDTGFRFLSSIDSSAWQFCCRFHSDRSRVTMSGFRELRDTLAGYGQAHVVRFYEELTDTEKKQLKSDVSSLNLEQVNEYFARATESLNNTGLKLDELIKPIPRENYQSVNDLSDDNRGKYEDLGFEAIARGSVGVLLLAGGQGTRLGSTQPKGMFNIGLPSEKSLFQIQAERILRLERLAAEKSGEKRAIKWYIMTSEHTMQPTLDFLKSHNYFGLNSDHIRLFEQGSLPCYDFEGRVILDQKHHIAMAPDGNGGLYKALKKNGILEHMRAHGVEHLHAHTVDNILMKVADPVFIGYCIAKNSDCAAKVVEKSSPDEAVGVVCLVEDTYQVVEYSEITKETSELRNEDGRLTFSAGNICNHYFSLDFLEKVCGPLESKLKLHVAKKKIPFVDESGVRHVPDKPNGIKIEKFIFDVFQFAQNFVTLEVRREEEFSALKNSNSAGKDCPLTAKQDLFKLHRAYIRRAGGTIDESVDCEISPLLSYCGEGLTDLVRSRKFSEKTSQLLSNEEIKKHSNGKQ